MISYRTCVMLAGVVMSACVGNLSIPDGADIRCESNAACPPNFECLDAHCVPNDGNQPPAVSLGAIAGSKTTVVIPLVVFDAESDVTTVSLALGTDENSTDLGASVTVKATPEGTPAQIEWNAAAFFAGGLARIPNLVVTATPRDAFRRGTPVSSEPFVFGNNAPVVSRVSVTTDLGVARGAVVVSFTVVDDNQVIDLTTVRLHTSTGVIEISLDATHFPDASLTAVPASLEGSTHTLLWQSGASAPIRDEQVTLEITVMDVLGDVSLPAASQVFALDNSPSLTATLDLAQGQRFLNAAAVRFVSTDPNQDLINITGQYRVAQGAWHPATVSGTSDPTTNLASSTLQHRFVWDALHDATTDAALAKADQDTHGDGSPKVPTLTYVEAVELQLVATDATGLSAAPVTLGPFALGDDEPRAVLQSVADAKESVAVPLLLSDSSNDLLNIELEFCWPQTGELCAQNAGAVSDGWRAAKIRFGLLTAVPSGVDVERVISWASNAPLEAFARAPQGLGDTSVESIALRARASDRVDGATPVFGPWSFVQTGRVLNQTPPRVTDVALRRLGLVGGVSPIAIDYTLVDDENDLVDINCEYSQNLGTSWQRCHEYLGGTSEGRYNLSSQSLNFLGVGGVPHRFIWDPTGQLQDASSTRLRLSATDGRGGVTYTNVLVPKPVGPHALLGPILGRESPSHLIDEGYGPTAQLAGLVGGDWNGDGRLDMAAAYANGQVLTFVAETGADATGTFASPNAYGAGSFPMDLATGDINGDGILDLVVANSGNTGNNAISVLLGSVSGTFTNGAAQVSGTPRALAVLDLNLDGKDDVVAVLTNSLVVALGASNGVSGTVYFAQNLLNGSYLDIAAADFDNDGTPDLALLSSAGLGILTGLGNNLFASATSPTFVVSAGAVVGLGDLLATGDIDYDGDIDIVIAANDGGYLFANNGLGDFTQSILSTRQANHVAMVDISGDGVLDVLLGRPASSGAQGMDFFVGDGAGGFAVPYHWYDNQNPTRRVVRTVVGNSGGDGAPDLIFGVFEYSGFQPVRRFVGAYRGDYPSYGTFNDWGVDKNIFGKSGNVALDADHRAALVSDFDNDGALDLATANASGIALWRGAGSSGLGRLPFAPASLTSIQYNASSLTTGDFDEDGVADLAVSGFAASGPVVDIHFGLTNLTLSAPLNLAEPTWHQPAAILAADINNDSHQDVVAAMTTQDMAVWLGDGTGTFALPISLTTGAHDETTLAVELGFEPRGLAHCDLDGDGNIDLAVTFNGGADDTLGGLSVFLGNGAGTFAPAPHIVANLGTYQSGWDELGPIYAPIAYVPYALVCADFDSDGKADIASVGVSRSWNAQGTAVVFFGQGSRADGDWSLGAELMLALGPVGISLAVGDVDHDGALDLAVGTSSYGYSVWRGSGARSFAKIIEEGTASVHRHGVILADVDNDQMLDVVVSDVTAARLWTHAPRFEARQPWHALLVAHQTNTASPAYWPNDLVALAPDRFGHATEAPSLTLHTAATTANGLPDVTALFRHTLPAQLARFAPLTKPWHAAGDQKLARDGERFMVVSRFANTLDLQASRGLIVPLPIESAWSNQAVDEGTVKVFAALIDYRRAEDDARYIESLAPRTTYVEIPRDEDGDLTTGDGPRFVVDFKAQHTRQVRVLTDHLGIFQAFVGQGVTP